MTNPEIKRVLAGAEHVARTIMKDQKGVTWPTVVVMDGQGYRSKKVDKPFQICFSVICI